MKTVRMGGRQLKKKILQLLQEDDFVKNFAEMRRLPARRVVNPLFSFLCSLDEQIKWRAVTAMGKVVADLAASEPESARVVMRRFIWQLNDESGGIGWGCPEAMAEAMAGNERFAGEYGRILVSYLQPDGNYLEHEMLQRGLLWGIGRLAHSRPQYLTDAATFLPPYLASADPCLRGLAAWAAGPLGGAKNIEQLNRLAGDPANLGLYRDGRLMTCSVGRLAREALKIQFGVR